MIYRVDSGHPLPFWQRESWDALVDPDLSVPQSPSLFFCRILFSELNVLLLPEITISLLIE